MSKLPIVAVMLFLLFVVTCGISCASEQDTQAKVESLQSQLKALQEQYQQQTADLQAQLNVLKDQFTIQQKEVKEKDSRITTLEEKTKPWVDKGFQSGSFKLSDAMGLDEDSRLNIAGEITMRYRQNEKTHASNPGFQFYELELFLDSALHKNLSIYAEYDLIHETKAEAEDIWIDLHTEDGPLAFAGGTGLKIGNFHYPFGWDNDDEEGYVYGGRTSVNSSLIRSERIDGWRLRERQVGIAGYYNFDPLRDLNLSFAAGVFNGNGDVNHYAGWDSDQAKDVATRVEAKYKDVVFGSSYLFAPYTRNIAANVNNTRHVRDIKRYGVHFKYPDVPFPSQDVSLGGKPWMLWGEFVWGDNNRNSHIAAASASQHVQGGYLELDAALKKDKMLGFIRYDYYDPDTKISRNNTFGITPGIRWSLWTSSTLTAEYEFYGGIKGASTNSIADEDRFALQLTTQF